MKSISRQIRVFIKNTTNQVAVRVRWDNKRKEVTFMAGVLADEQKWNKEGQKAMMSTVHHVHGKVFTASTINGAINELKQGVDKAFYGFEMQEIVPTTDELKEAVNVLLERNVTKPEEETVDEKSTLTFDEVLEMFIKLRPMETTWSDASPQKYRRLGQILHAFKKKVRFEDFDKDFLTQFKVWMVDNKAYVNITIKRYFGFLLTFLRWADNNEYANVKKEVLHYKLNLPAPKKVVVRLLNDELVRFLNFSFPDNKAHLGRARDMFVFMCVTSLRYSDLRALKKANLSDGALDIYVQKTKKKLHIPLDATALSIIEKYKDFEGPSLLPVISNVKLNAYIHEAAEMAGLNREIQTTTYRGGERIDEIHPLHELLTCHCGRRTFVCSMLTSGVPVNTVMSITGHSNTESMKPYIAIADKDKEVVLDSWKQVFAQEKVKEQEKVDDLASQVENLSPEMKEMLLKKLMGE